MFTEEFKKACEGCQSEEELKAVIDAHKSELTDEELQQVSGGYYRPIASNVKSPFDLNYRVDHLSGNDILNQTESNEAIAKIN